MTNAPGRAPLGTCCDALQGVMNDTDCEPLITLGDDGVLYMATGIVDSEDAGPDEAGFLEHPVYFCPFCGTELQTEDEVERKRAGTPS